MAGQSIFWLLTQLPNFSPVELLNVVKITDHNWAVQTASRREKQALFDYATARQVPIVPAGHNCVSTGFRDDESLRIGYYYQGLISYEAFGATSLLITPQRFKELCDAYLLENGYE
jgi:hypothetical protein